MLKTIISLVAVLSFLLLVVLLNTTTPSTIGPIGLLFMFVLAYFLFVSLLTAFLFETSKIVSKFSKIFMTRRPIIPWTSRKSYYYSSVLAAAPIMVIGLQSVGALGFYELMLIILFCVLGCLYVSKRIF